MWTGVSYVAFRMAIRATVEVECIVICFVQCLTKPTHRRHRQLQSTTVPYRLDRGRTYENTNLRRHGGSVSSCHSNKLCCIVFVSWYLCGNAEPTNRPASIDDVGGAVIRKYRITQLNAGQLRLLVSFVENKVPGLTNKTVLDAYTKLLRKATAETDKRHEEEVCVSVVHVVP